MMKKIRAGFVLSAAMLLAAIAHAPRAADLDEITVAYFLEWPTPNQVAQVEKAYDKAMGLTVHWRNFSDGNAMSAAMVSGDVQIAYSQGLVPFSLAAARGLPIKAVGVAASYSESDNCVVHKDAGITQKNARELEGKKIGTSVGNVSHYKLLNILNHLGVDVSKVHIIPMDSPTAAAALARGDVTMACAFGGPLTRMQQYGEVLMTAAEQEAIGVRVFDVISVTNTFAADHPHLVVKFLQVTEDFNRAFLRNPDPARPIIARAAGMSLEAANESINTSVFPNRDEQLSDNWLGSFVPGYIKQVVDFYRAQGQIEETMVEDYRTVIDTSFLSQVK